VGGIVHHVAIDRLREIYRQRLVTSESADQVAPYDDPYRCAEAADEERLMHQAILAAPSSCRELWRLMLVEHLSYEQIGERLSIPAGTVKSRMWYCRRKVANALRRLRLTLRASPRR
jgi:RNA polymerase sigma factor (sigma-70 family)